MFHFSVIVKSCLLYMGFIFFFLKKQGLVKTQLNFIIISFQYRNIILKIFCILLEKVNISNNRTSGYSLYVMSMWGSDDKKVLLLAIGWFDLPVTVSLRSHWLIMLIAYLWYMLCRYTESSSSYFSLSIHCVLLSSFFIPIFPACIFYVSCNSVIYALCCPLTTSFSPSLSPPSKRIGRLRLLTSVYHCPERAKQRGDGGVS